MQIDSDEALSRALEAPREPEDFDFKEAKSGYAWEDLFKYVSAFANEGGGSLILGVSDKPPRKVVGTAAFPDLEHIRSRAYEILKWRISTREFQRGGRRILVISTNGVPRGRPLAYDGRYYMRTGSSLRIMGPDELRTALSAPTTDFSSDICPGATLADLSPDAIEDFRRRSAPGANAALRAWTDAQLLENTELTIDGAVTYAALILLGTPAAIGRRLPHAEVVFEYRASEADIGSAERREYRSGLLLWLDEIWERINARNLVFQLRQGLFREDVSAFDEETLREAILNAVCHRDYENPGNCWVRMYPRRIEVESPGGFFQGVTPENILDRQAPRNRRLAEALRRCHLVERSGQGADLMFRNCIRAAKALPDYSRSDDYRVLLELRGEVTDPNFVRFLNELAEERQDQFATPDLLVLDLVRRKVAVPASLHERRDLLLRAGAIERVQRGKLILSRRYREFTGEVADYDRDKGLDRAEERKVLLDRLTAAGSEGLGFGTLLEALPGRSRSYVARLLEGLREDGAAELRGSKRTARWHIPAGGL